MRKSFISLGSKRLTGFTHSPESYPSPAWRRSFTLIETLIALTIFSFLAVSFYMLLCSGLSVRKKFDSQVLNPAAVYLDLEIIARELRNSFIYKPPPDTCGFSGENNRLSFYTVLCDYAAAKPKIVNVVYTFEGSALHKVIKHPFADEEISYDFIENIIEGKFYYFNDANEEWEESWESEGKPPHSIKIDFKCKDDKGNSAEFSKYIFVRR